MAALALIFVYETESGVLPASIAGVCAALSVPLAIWFVASAIRQRAGRPASLTLALAYAVSALQAASYAALLALTAPQLRGSRLAAGLGAACRWISILLSG
ncbi:hypothetical protein CTI14_44905, partial [Methylobacterium radiotolerans]